MARAGRRRAGRLTLTVAIRRGGASDWSFVHDLGKRVAMTSTSSLRPAIPSLVELAYEKLVNFVSAQSHVLLIASDEEKPLGFLILLDTMPDEVTLSPQAFVAYMAVEPEARRRRIGRALLNEAEGVARELGLPCIAMMVTEENEAARELYAKNGFQTERRLLCKNL